jgi:hypothetical protein
VTARGKEIIAPDGKLLRLRGIGMGNWLVQEGYMFKLEGGLYESPHEIHNLVSALVGADEARAFWAKFYDNYVTKDDIDFLEKAGFNSIRVPFNYKLVTPEDQSVSPPPQSDPARQRGDSPRPAWSLGPPRESGSGKTRPCQSTGRRRRIRNGERSGGRYPYGHMRLNLVLYPANLLRAFIREIQVEDVVLRSRLAGC